MHLNQHIQSYVENLFKNKSEYDILDKMPKGNPSFLGQLSIDIDGMFGMLLSTPELKLQARNDLTEYGLMIEDFGKAFTGDVILGSFKNENAQHNSILFGLEINELAHFDQILEVMYQLDKIEQEKVNLYRMNTSFIPFLPFHVTYQDSFQRMLIKEGHMFVSLDKNLINSIQNQEFISLSHLVNTDKNNVISAYGSKDFDQLKNYTEQFAIQDYQVAYDSKSLKLSLNLADKNTSSIKQLLDLE